VLDTNQPAVLAHRCDWQGRGVLVLHNLGPEPVQAEVELDDEIDADGPMAELFGDQRYEPVRAGQPLALDGFGFRWLRLFD
jgi:maltose alpha-D-glucosyltransferase/alpha-amylase